MASVTTGTYTLTRFWVTDECTLRIHKHIKFLSSPLSPAVRPQLGTVGSCSTGGLPHRLTSSSVASRLTGSTVGNATGQPPSALSVPIPTQCHRSHPAKTRHLHPTDLHPTASPAGAFHCSGSLSCGDCKGTHKDKQPERLQLAEEMPCLSIASASPPSAIRCSIMDCAWTARGPYATDCASMLSHHLKVVQLP